MQRKKILYFGVFAISSFGMLCAYPSFRQPTYSAILIDEIEAKASDSSEPWSLFKKYKAIEIEHRNVTANVSFATNSTNITHTGQGSNGSQTTTNSSSNSTTQTNTNGVTASTTVNLGNAMVGGSATAGGSHESSKSNTNTQEESQTNQQGSNFDKSHDEVSQTSDSISYSTKMEVHAVKCEEDPSGPKYSCQPQTSHPVSYCKHSTIDVATPLEEN